MIDIILETISIKSISNITYGYTEKSKTNNQKYKYLRITDIQGSNVQWNDVPFCDISDENFPKYKLSKGDIVFARTGATTGKSYLINDCPDSVYASYLIRVKLKNGGFEPKYVHYFFQTPSYWASINSGISGSTLGGFNAKKLGELRIPQFTLSEQRQIVEKLDTAFDLIERAKANIEKNIQNAKELFQSKLNQVFSEGKGKVSAKTWNQKFLNEISTNLDSKRVPITKSHRIPGTIPYYGASGIVDYVKDYIFEGTFLLVSEDGANLVMRTYPIAFTAEGKSWVNNHAHILQFKDSWTHKFVEYYLNSIKLDAFISGMAQPKLNQAMLNKIPVYLPVSLDEQQKIVEQLDQLSVQSELLQKKYQQKLANLEELKKSILEQAFKGELV